MLWGIERMLKRSEIGKIKQRHAIGVEARRQWDRQQPQQHSAPPQRYSVIGAALAFLLGGPAAAAKALHQLLQATKSDKRYSC